MEEKIERNPGIISYVTYRRIWRAIESGGIPKTEIRYALKNVHIYGIPEGEGEEVSE